MQCSITEEAVRRRLSVNVRALRNGARLTLKSASERAEMHWRHWQKIEAGQVNITLQTLVRVAEVLSVDPSDLLREPPARLNAPLPGASRSAPSPGAPDRGPPELGAQDHGAPGAGAPEPAGPASSSRWLDAEEAAPGEEHTPEARGRLAR